jgi:hypothetical protein
MIELPPFARFSNFQASMLDAGFTQRGVQSLDRIDRKGSRHKIALTCPPLEPEEGRVMVRRLIRAKQEGIRVPLPVLHSQGAPGAVTLAANVSTGRTIQVQGGTPGYVCKEGFWLSLENTAGQHFLHSVSGTVRFSATGTATLTLDLMVRDTFVTGNKVHLAKPMVEGLVEGDEWAWAFSVERVIPIEFALEEAR